MYGSSLKLSLVSILSNQLGTRFTSFRVSPFASAIISIWLQKSFKVLINSSVLFVFLSSLAIVRLSFLCPASTVVLL
nr:MAG TPA: hypothetical protein [Caudoviricetes sp.]